MEACLTCMCCMNVLSEPAACVPCGHTFCAGCLDEGSGACPECEGPASHVVKMGSLSTLVSKFNFQKQTLSALATTTTQAAVATKFATAIGSRAAA